MGRVLSPYEIAWRKSAGHPVDDDDELERLTAPSGAVPPAVVVAVPAPVATTPVATEQPPAPPPAPPAVKPTAAGKK